MLKRVSFLVIAAAVAILACLVDAAAQPLVTYVSGRGADSGSCDSQAAPCRTFQYAVDHTEQFGEVQALDPANYGPVTINVPVSITGVEGAGIFTDANPGVSAAITINAGPVHLQRLTLDGRRYTADPAPTGILINGSGKFTITQCTVQNYLQTGIDIHGANASFLVADTLVSGNQYGINISPQSAGGILDHVWVYGNSAEGLDVSGTPPVTAVGIVVTYNRIGIGVSGSGLTLTRSTITGSWENGIYIPGSASNPVVRSLGDNYITDNIYGGTLTHVGAQ
jgi:hypothetical protein